jgi:integrase/recombinase XerD
MDRIDTIEVPRTLPRPTDPDEIQAVFGAICSGGRAGTRPVDVLRDRVLLGIGLRLQRARASEVCGTYVEDLDLRPDASTPASTVRAAPCCRMTAAMSRCYGSTWSGPGTPRARSSARAPTAAAARCPRTQRTAGGRSTALLRALRSASTSSATPTPPSCVSIEVVRRRLGHASAETTQVYCSPNQSRRGRSRCAPGHHHATATASQTDTTPETGNSTISNRTSETLND